MFDPSDLDLDINNEKKKDSNKIDNTNGNTDKKENINENEKKDLASQDDGENIEEVNEIDSQKSPDISKENKEEENLKNNSEDILGSLVNEIDERESIGIGEENNSENDEKNIIYDININSLDDIINILKIESHDYVIFEPEEESVKVIFKKDQINKDIKHIKHHIYSSILIKAKTSSGLDVNNSSKSQQGDGKLSYNGQTYKVSSKTVPDNFGEKLFFKIKSEGNPKNIKVKKSSIGAGKLLGFLGALAVVSLIIGGAFITFVVLNAKTVEDVNFFVSLGINLNDINSFISTVVQVIFSILIFFETIFLAIFLFKFLLTKKQLKKKRIGYAIMSIFLLFVLFGSGGLWMSLTQKVASLPKWEIWALGDIQVYDNTMLLNEEYKDLALITDYGNIIGPINIKFDLEAYTEKEKSNGFNVEQIFWNFGDGEISQTFDYTYIKEFDEKGTYELSIEAKGTDFNGELITKKIKNKLDLNISHIVLIDEERIDTGGKIVSFDASDLKDLGKIEWSLGDDLGNPVIESYRYKHSAPIFDDTVFGMNIIGNDGEKDYLDKIFIISGEDESGIDGEIVYEQNKINDLKYEFKVENIENTFGKGYVETFKWIIGEEEEILNGEITNQTESSKLDYTFKVYGEHTIKVIMYNSLGDTKELVTKINIVKKLGLKEHLSFYVNNKDYSDYNYDEKNNEYYVNNLSAPVTLDIDARYVKAENSLYSLSKVEWDTDGDGDMDKSGNNLKYYIGNSGNFRIGVRLKFQHRKFDDKFIVLDEIIYADSLLRDDLLNLRIEKDSEYVPVIVRFDGSKSMIKGENISKYVWDFGDGSDIQEGDSIIQGHKYISSGEYKVVMKVITENGEEYSITKMLILKPEAEEVEISTSMKKAPTFQGIDFSSEKSTGQIISYLWDFGDGETSTKANPTHIYKKTGDYKVTLTIEFPNRNIKKDTIDIVITE